MDPEACVKRIEDAVGGEESEDFWDAVDDYQTWRLAGGATTPELDGRVNAACVKQGRIDDETEDGEQ